MALCDHPESRRRRKQPLPSPLQAAALFVAPFLIAVATAAPQPVSAQAHGLNNPFTATLAKAAARRAADREAPPAPCPAVPPPVLDLEATSYYSDARATIIDPDRLARNRAQVKPLNDFMALIADQTTQALSSTGAQRAEASACVITLLDGWASRNALSGRFNAQGASHRRWVINAIAIDFLAVTAAGDPDAAATARVRQWFGRIGREIVSSIGRIQNNHLYWAAAAAASTGVASGDRQLLSWATLQMREGLSEVTEQGALPREIARGARALNYHIFAIEPLLQVIILARANGWEPSPQDVEALHRLSGLIARNLSATDEFGALAGVPQKWDGMTDFAVSWAALMATALPPADCALAKLAAERPTLKSAYLGGNIRLLYPVRLPPSCAP